MYTEKIFVQKLNKFLGDIVVQYNKSHNFNDFLKFSTNQITTPNNPDEILKYFYFNKFYEILQSNNIITNTNKLNENYISELENTVLKGFVNYNLTMFNFLKMYGNFDKNLLKKLFSIYRNGLDDKALFFQTSKIFWINAYKDENWESLCKNNLDANYTDTDFIDPLSQKLIRHVNKNEDKYNFKTKDFMNFTPRNKKTQAKIKNTLVKFGIKYEEEYKRDGYKYDYYLPELNAVLEYDGPDHFYPLQTQLNETNKFRYKNIYENFKCKLISIPFFEFMRYDTTELTEAYLKQVIYKDYDLFSTPLFEENYDLFKNMRKYTSKNSKNLI
jgi:hypothetical protein